MACIAVDSVSEAGMSVKPQNKVVLVGNKVTLHCSSAHRGALVRWTFGTQNVNCRRPIYKHGECNVVIDSVRSSDAGAYDCTDGSSTMAQASLVVIGITQHTPSQSLQHTHTQWLNEWCDKLHQCFSTFSLKRNPLQQFWLVTEPTDVARNRSCGALLGPEKIKPDSGERIIGPSPPASVSGEAHPAVFGRSEPGPQMHVDALTTKSQ